MGYADTQAEIIQAQLRPRSPGWPRPASVPAAPAPPAAQPTTAARPAAPPHAGRLTVVSPAVADDAAVDLAAAIEAARRLRYEHEVEQIVAAAGLTVEQMRGRGQGRALIEVRWIVAAYLRRRGCSLPEIGRVLGRDHTSVLKLLRAPSKVIRLYEGQA